MSPAVLLQYVLPHRLMSWTVRQVTHSKIRWLKNLLIRRIVKAYDVNMADAAETDLDAYPSFNAFFTRALKPGARPLDPDPTAILMPADGRISQAGRIEDGRIFQAKGQSFTAEELLGSADAAAPFKDGQFATIYLSPRDYHRVHMPWSGKLRETVHIPGRLFSVAPFAVEGVPRLFARNERLVCHFDTDFGPMAVVMVGAMLVSGIETVWRGPEVPPYAHHVTTRDYRNADIHLERGAEMARFNMGSTVIVLLPANTGIHMPPHDAEFPVMQGTALAARQGLVLNKHGATSSVAFCCAVDEKPKYLTQAVRWAQSIRWFAGSLCDADLFIGHCADIPSPYRRMFNALNIRLIPVERMSDWHGPSNKLGVLQSSELDDYEAIVFSDCDVIFAGDPSGELQSGKLRAKPADVTTLRNDVLAKIFEHAGIRVPTARLITTIDEVELIPYCNSGVIVLPRQIRKRFVDRWIFWNRWMLEQSELLGDRAFFTDQASFALTLPEFMGEFEALGANMNFPCHFEAQRYPSHLHETEVLVAHYHHRVDGKTGYLELVGIPGVDSAIRMFNEKSHELRRTSFENTIFWDTRYLLEPELGSGIGSRGEHATYKHALVSSLLSEHPGVSLVDYGCGDCSLLSAIHIPRYTGVDGSPEVIRKNTERFPDSHFINEDLGTTSATGDISLCFDVLIHQPTQRDFDAIIDRIIANTRIGGLLNGFEEKPGFTSDIIFHHEALSSALTRRGLAFRRAGEYRETVIYQWMHA